MMKVIQTLKNIEDHEAETPLDRDEPHVRTMDGTKSSFNEVYGRYNVGRLVHSIVDIKDSQDALRQVGYLYSCAKWERLYAEQNGWRPEFKFWGQILESLQEAFKIINSMNMTFGTEAKIVPDRG